MAVSTTVDFNNSANFTFDSTKVDFPGSVAQLALESVAADFTQTFTSDSGFTYDNTKASFTGSQVQQLDLRAADAIWAANFNLGFDSNWNSSGGTVTPTQVGTPTIVSDKLDCTGGGNNGLIYADATLSGAANKGAIKFKYTAGYTTTTTGNVGTIALLPSSGNNNRLLLRHNRTNGRMLVDLYDSTGTPIASVGTSSGDFGVWNTVSGTTYEVEFNWDGVAGTMYFLVDGVLIGSQSPGAFTRGGTATNLYVGANPTYASADATFDDVLVFNDIQHTSGYTPGYTVSDYVYESSNVTLPAFTYSGVGTLLTYNSLTTVQTSTPRYTIQSDSGSFKYWNGSAWVASDGTYAQANTQADMSANLSALTDASGAASATVRVHFTGTNTQAAVDNLVLNHNGQNNYYTDDPPVTQVSGIEVDDITSFSAVTSASGSDTVTFIMNANGVDKYWDGAAWSNSDGSVAQSNTAADVNANIDSFDFSAGVTVKWKTLLHSDDGTTTPTVTSITFVYDFFTSKPGAINECILYGWEEDLEGVAVEGATVRVTLLTPFFHGNRRFSALRKETTTDSTGYWEISVIETATISTTVIVQIESADGSGGVNVKSYTITVPDAVSASLASLV